MENKAIEQKKEGIVKITIFVILTSNFFRLIGISVAEISLPYYILSLSGTLTSFGLVIGIFYFTQSIFQIPMAMASDKFGRKRIILLGIFIFTLGTFLCYFAQDLLQLTIFRAIQGIGAYSAIIEAFLGESYKKEGYGKGMSYYIISYTLGYFGGISLGGYISFYLGFRSVFFISGILAGISGLLVFFFFRDKKIDIGNDLSNPKTKFNKSSFNFSDIKLLLKNPQFGFIVLISSMRWLIFGGIVSYIIWFLEVQFHLDQIQTSYILILIVSIYILFVAFTGKLTNRLGSKKIMLLGQLIIISFGLLYYFVEVTNELLLYILASSLSSIGLGLFETSVSTITLEKIEKIDSNLKGTGFGISNTVGFLCSALGPIVLSLMGEISLFLPYYFMILFILISFLITFKFVDG